MGPDQPHHEPPRPTRRRVLRAAVWVTPAIVAVQPAPAFASSTTVTLTATKNLTTLIITFTNGAANYLVTLSSITWTGALFTSGTVPVNQATTYSSLGGTFSGGAGSAALLTSRTYTVTYVYNSQSFTATLTA